MYKIGHNISIVYFYCANLCKEMMYGKQHIGHVAVIVHFGWYMLQ